MTDPSRTLRNRQILAALCGAAAILTAALALRLALRSGEAGPAVLTETGDASETAALFFHALCLRDWQRASGYVKGAPELELSDAPEDSAERALWTAFLLSWSWSMGDGGKTDELHAWQEVSFTSLRPDALTDGLRRDIQTVLARKVDEARTEGEVYTETGDYRSEVVEAALMEALAGRLTDQTPYLVTTKLTLELVYEDGRWQILPSEALWDALSGVPEGRESA